MAETPNGSTILHCHTCGHEWQWEPEDGDGPQDCPNCDDRARATEVLNREWREVRVPTSPGTPERAE